MKYWKTIFNEIELIKSELTWTSRNSKKLKYVNTANAFDIESTSFYENDEKRAVMYIWMLGLNHRCYYGRTWDEFIDCIDFLSASLQTDLNHILVIYVHNLTFEFQFFRKKFEWDKVFASEERKVIFARTISGVEFRCSYFLSGYSLSNLAKNLHKYKIEKLVGDLDYSKIRTPITPLNDKEMGYCKHDIQIIMYYIQEKLDEGENISDIPYTNTGYVRNFCRNYCFYNNGPKRKNRDTYREYRQFIEALSLTTEEYNMLKQAYQGGFTHANPWYSGKVMNDVHSFDFTSSYPTVMVSEMFPMSKGEKIKIDSKEIFLKSLKHYCCLFTVEFTYLDSKLDIDSPISVSKCFVRDNVVENNGRVVSADRIQVTITEQDFLTIRQFYTWKTMKIGTFYRYRKMYLPKNLILSVLKLYKDKTELKDVDGEEVNYMRSKNMINATYGMMVTDIVKDETIYCDDVWSKELANVESNIGKYNNSKKRFLFYPWGVWVTAYARRNLFTGIKEFDADYIYSDTDSIKGKNKDKHMRYINKYNEIIINKIEKCLSFYGIDVTSYKPKNKKGISKPLGVWDYEGMYDRFKTLGAKRYIVEKDNKITITVSGVNKKVASNYLQDTYGMDGAFEMFEDDLIIPADKTGKMIHTYIDNECEGYVKDYLGNYYHYKEQSGVHLENTSYSLSLSSVYIDYLTGLRRNEV